VYINAVIFNLAGQTTEFALWPMRGFPGQMWAELDQTCQDKTVPQKKLTCHFGCQSCMWRHHYYYYYYFIYLFIYFYIFYTISNKDPEG